ncbi:ATP-binding protein [Anabaena sp. UHCC 0204]|uniref:ATP-binding protein n=1 Tax=Anabaena sp. UHCC 0204 TaxID=2590009 RepID=UPI0014473A38|nr:ATP-binding protein [Anabaena sp. UHCC 0204]MTJ06433.1 ATP-binding protein [Anabaena sp. UHCC 0204]
MAFIEEIIKQSINPFDNFASSNFWKETQEKALTVESIHQEALVEIEKVLKQVSNDRIPRTLILAGDAGVGKTYFLGRLKKILNSQAFFVYIEPFVESQYIWRHILRYTVDSLVKSPDGQKDSQLLLWLKSCFSSISNGLEAEEKNLIEKIKRTGVNDNGSYLRERQQFIDILKNKLGLLGIYNAHEFFGVLYQLTNPKLHYLACEWLKGDNLDQDSLKNLGVGRSIDTEDAARKILANFSKISAKSKPIVWCFDQLDNIAKLANNSIDLPTLFSANSTIHNEQWQGMLVIISIINSTWNQNKKLIPDADLDRVNTKISLKRITLEQAKSLWATRLYPLHTQVKSQPSSDIFPLTEHSLKEEFPGGKVLPREVLQLGKELIQKYKGGIDKIDLVAAFKLLWLYEFQKVEKRITHISQCSSVELVRMLKETLSALQVRNIQPKLLPSSTYAEYSFSYQVPDQTEKIGITWTEEANMTTFCYIMKACHKVVQRKLCNTLYLIRAQNVGNTDLVGNKIFTEIFTNSDHRRIQPDLNSVHYLVTYHNLVNAACAGELVVDTKIIKLEELESLIRASEIMRECYLLQELGFFTKNPGPDDEKYKKMVKEFLFNLVQTNQILGRKLLTDKAEERFNFVKDLNVELLLEELCQENKIKIIPPNEKPEKQSVCWIPN